METTNLINALEKGWVTRPELRILTGLPDSSARGVVSAINLNLSKSDGRCVLSSARTKGYHIPSFDSADDLSLAESIVDELESKAISIFEHRKAVQEYIRRARERQGLNQEIQLTLF